MTRKRTRSNLGISTLEDITTLILQSHDLHETLENVAELVSRRMVSAVCSIYLLEDDGNELVLQATKGLPPETVGQVRMHMGEGLASLAIEEGRPISVINPSRHPRYRYFPITEEERYASFLAVPLLNRSQAIGVIVIQSTEQRAYSATEISALTTIAFQIAAVVTNAKLLDYVSHTSVSSAPLAAEDLAGGIRLKGNVAYPGVISGPAYILDNSCGFADVFDEADIDVERELQRVQDALEETRIHTLMLEKRVARKLSEEDAAIFHTHLMILEDRGFQDQLSKEIKAGHSAPYALKKVISSYTETFANIEDPYLRERATDIMDIGRRMLSSLTGRENKVLKLKHKGILLAHEIMPSDMAVLDHEKILGIVTESGERNSHAVIMAKSLGIPALVGVKGVTNRAEPGELTIVDANSGCLYLKPSEAVIEEYRRLEEDCSKELKRINKYRLRPALTRDDVKVTMRANIGLVSDVDIALRNGAEGVGLYRTEFPYMTRSNFPDRQDQYQLYRKIVESFADEEVTIRTLDIGGDKSLPYFNLPHEDNPFMGWRSVRVSLDNPDIFRTQIEAILMAGAHGRVKMLFPMISGIEEIQACKQMVEEAKSNLCREHIPFCEDIPLGVMVEVPAAVQMCKFLAQEVDFFSLGTNDLIQYMLAADRNNQLVNKYYNPLHPAVLQAIKYVADTAQKSGKGVCICGEMATDPVNFTVLLGLGIREFSVVAPFIPRIKAFLADIEYKKATEITDAVLQMGSATEIKDYLVDALLKMHKGGGL
jgi:phosphotransferase system enzyme I (PtsP)